MRFRKEGRYWPLLLVGWIATLLLGHWGFVLYFRQAGIEKTFIDILYLDAQLYKLSGGSVDGQVPWQLNVARMAAPAIAAIAIYRAVFLFAGDRLRERRIRRMRDHIIVCGKGDVALQIATSAADAGRRVVVLASGDEPGRLETWKARGGLVLNGDPAEPETLRAAALARAQAIVAASDDDAANINIALAAHRTLGNAKRNAPLACHVQVLDPDLSGLVRGSPLVRGMASSMDLHVLNTYATTARITALAHPLDREPISATDARVPQLILLGFGRMGAALALQYAQVSHFANAKPLEIAIFDRAAASREKSFLARHPGIDQICRLRFHERALDDMQAIETIRELAARADALTTVFVCLDNESQSLAFGLAAQTALRGMRVPIFVRMRSTAGLASVLGGVPDLGAFGALEQVCDWTALDTGHLDRLAKEVHALYLSKRSRDGGASRPAWNDLDPVLQDSCRQQADHVGAKLRAARCAVEPGPDGSFAFSPEEIEILARMEHRRWVAERILNGWRPGPRDETRRTTPYLVDYDDLTDDIKDYDRDTIRNLPKLLAMSGHRVRRVA